MVNQDDKMEALLKMAEEFTHSILKTSLQMRASELDHRKKSKMVQQGVISGKDDPRKRGREPNNGPAGKNSKRKQ